MQSASTMITPTKECVLYTGYRQQIQCYSFIIIILSGGKASVIQFLRTLKGHSHEMFYHSIYGALWRGYNGFWEIFYIYKYFEFNLFSSLSNPLFSNAKSVFLLSSRHDIISVLSSRKQFYGIAQFRTWYNLSSFL